MKGNIFSPEDKEFMDIVLSDLQKYLQKNIFPSRTVLVFPPFNGFRRFLIHKLIEDNFASSEVAAFSIGVENSRRIVVCYKGLIREGTNKGPSATLHQGSKFSMIEKEKPSRQKLTPTAAVYRPPAARLAESRKSTDDVKTADTKQTRVRRPDQQMYVPRPKRVTYGNEMPRSRSHSSSRLSSDSDKSSDLKNNSSTRLNESRMTKNNVISNSDIIESNNRPSNTSETMGNDLNNVPTCVNVNVDSKPVDEEEYVINRDCGVTDNDPNKPLMKIAPFSSVNNDYSAIQTDSEEVSNLNVSESAVEVTFGDLRNADYIQNKNDDEMQVDSINIVEGLVADSKIKSEELKTEEISTQNEEKSSKQDEHSKLAEEDISKQRNEAMETISVSSDSRSEGSRSEYSRSEDSSSSDSSSSFTSSSDSKLSESSDDSELEKKRCKHKNSEKMEIDHIEDKNIANKAKGNLKEKQTKSKNSSLNISHSEVLFISDSSSSNDNMRSANDSTEKMPNIKKPKDKSSLQGSKVKKTATKNRTIDPDECDWESLYDDSGECLVPSLMEELTGSLGRVRVTSADSDYRPYQTIDERTSDGECIIEIYDFPAEFKTTDLLNIFAAYRNKNFQIKWVDDTHALGVFPSPLMADEVLACTLPFVKTRPLRLGIAESRNKARGLVLPPLPSAERPKTCTALARRLVSGALGLRLPTSSHEREREKELLKEAREKRRLEAKQREAAWDGTIANGTCI